MVKVLAVFSSFSKFHMLLKMPLQNSNYSVVNPSARLKCASVRCRDLVFSGENKLTCCSTQFIFNSVSLANHNTGINFSILSF